MDRARITGAEAPPKEAPRTRPPAYCSTTIQEMPNLSATTPAARGAAFTFMGRWYKNKPGLSSRFV